MSVVAATSGKWWIWAVFLTVFVGGIVRALLERKRSGRWWRVRSPFIEAHPRVFGGAVVVVIVAGWLWLIIQSVG